MAFILATYFKISTIVFTAESSEVFLQYLESFPPLINGTTYYWNVVAKDENGKGYSIKTITKPTGTTGSFWNPESIENNEEKFSNSKFECI